MRKIAHIINPFRAKPPSDLAYAQPITFETMRIAKAFAVESVEVELYTAQYEEDLSVVPEDFQSTPNLGLSVQDFGKFYW